MRWHWLSAGLVLAVLPALVWAGDEAQPQDKDTGKAYAVPFRLTDSGHIMVRVKINGKGPYNFIVDTGAPLVYIAVPVAKKIGIPAEPKGKTTVERIDIEGGPVQTKFKCLVDTPFQLEGMNALGLAGVELHGILGASLLAQYKMEIDLTKDRMTWTKLDFMPPAPQPIGKDGGLDPLARLMKLLAWAMGDSKGIPAPAVRGFFGMDLEDKDNQVVVKSVLSKCPAAAAGLQAGDVVLAVEKRDVQSRAELVRLLATVTPGQIIRFQVVRDGKRMDVTVTAGEGL